MTNSDFDTTRDSRRKSGRQRSGVQKITSVETADQGGNGLFIGGLALILIAGAVAIGFFAVNRETNIGVSPRANFDHWHAAYVVNNCGEDLPPAGQFDSDAGIHTHGDGILHIHPSQLGAGRNATLDAYFSSGGASISDDELTPLISDLFGDSLSEETGCNGEPAELQVAVWDNAFDLDAEPTIYTEDLAAVRFANAGQAITIALVAEGDEIAPPPPERIGALQTIGTGDAGIELGDLQDFGDPGTGADHGGGDPATEPESDVEPDADEQ